MADSTSFPKGIEVVCSAIIENPDRQILLVQSPKWHNKWLLPGGHIEPGETIFQAITRESKEETNLTVTPIAITGAGQLINSPDFHRPGHFVFFNIYCLTRNLTVTLDQIELINYQWLTPTQALTLNLADSYAATIQELIKYKNKK